LEKRDLRKFNKNLDFLLTQHYLPCETFDAYRKMLLKLYRKPTFYYFELQRFKHKIFLRKIMIFLRSFLDICADYSLKFFQVLNPNILWLII